MNSKWMFAKLVLNCIHTTYTLHTHYIHTTYTLRTHYIHTTYTLHTHYIHTTYTLRTHYIHTTLYTLYTTYTLHAHYTHTTYIQYIHTTYTLSTYDLRTIQLLSVLWEFGVWCSYLTITSPRYWAGQLLCGHQPANTCSTSLQCHQWLKALDDGTSRSDHNKCYQKWNSPCRPTHTTYIHTAYTLHTHSPSPGTLRTRYTTHVNVECFCWIVYTLSVTLGDVLGGSLLNTKEDCSE
jgi:hypothetical protein